MLSKTLFILRVCSGFTCVLAYLNIHTQNIITIGANYHVLICYRLCAAQYRCQHRERVKKIKERQC